MTQGEDRILTGPELIELIGQYPTLDGVLDRNPHLHKVTDEEIMQQIKRNRAERALAQVKSAARKAKKEGIVDPEVSSDEE